MPHPLRRFLLLAGSAIFASALAADHSLSSTAIRAPSEAATAALGSSPLRSLPAAATAGIHQPRFERNQGQFAAPVRFVARSTSYAVGIARTEVLVLLGRGSGAEPAASPELVRMRFLGAEAMGALDGEQRLSTKTHYFHGNDPERWHADVPNFGAVRAADLYPGIDLLYHPDGPNIEQDFLIEPGADPSRIAIAFGAGDGSALIPRLDPGGDAVLPAGDLELRLRKPVAYQTIDGSRRDVDVVYTLRDGALAFRLGAYDPRATLVIDPVLQHSSYLGGSGNDRGYDLAVDAAGNLVIAGSTASANFPTASPLDSTLGGSSDAFIAKLDSSGSNLLFATFFGGSGSDEARGLTLDSAGNIYVTGNTSSTNLPTVSAFRTTSAGGQDGFVVKLNPTGSSVVYSTYLGGSGTDVAEDIAVDAAGNATIAGQTVSTNFPTMNPIQPAFGGSSSLGDAFVTKLAAAGNALVYSTYLGGSSDDLAFAVALDAGGSAYVTGWTRSSNFPTASPLQPGYAGGDDVFVAKLNPSGTSLAYSTYLGGSAADVALDIAVDSSGNVHLAGWTRSSNFPTVNAADNSYNGGQDGFAVKINASGTAIVYSTYLGGSGDDLGISIDVNAAGEAFVGGNTKSSNFPLVSPTQGSYAGGNLYGDAFLVRLSAAGSTILFSTYYGGSGDENCRQVRVDGGSVLLIGFTGSTNLPTVNPIQPANGGADDVFLARISTFALLSIAPSSGPTAGGTEVILTGEGFDSSVTVTFGGTPATSVNVISSTSLRATTPSRPAGIVDVVVAKPNGERATLARAFFYTDAGAVTLTLLPESLTVEVGLTATITATISAAQTTATIVALSIGDARFASIPTSVTIPAGATAASFEVGGVATGGPTVIRGTLPDSMGAATATSTVTVVASRFVVRLIVPGQARAAGFGGSFFKSSFWMTNPTDSAVSVRLRYVPSTGGSSGGAATAREVSLAPGESIAYADVLGEALGATSDTFGVIVVEVAVGMATPIVTSRTFNESNRAKQAGVESDARATFGQYIPAVPISAAATGEVWIHGLGGDAASRSNLGVVSMSPGAMNATAAVFDGAGMRRGNDVPISVGAHSLVQVSRINEAAGAGLLPVFSVRVTASSPFFAYASKLDNTTSDPIFIPSTLTAKALQWIDGIASATGAGGTIFKSNLSLTNPGDATANVTIEAIRRGETAVAVTANVTLGQKESRFYGDVLSQLFGMGSAIVSLTLTTDTTTPVVAWARTYSDQGAAGTFGQFIPGVGRSELIGAKGAVFQGISENETFRSNMGMFNRGMAPVDAIVSVHQKNGVKSGEKTYAVGPGQAIAVSRIVNDAGVPSLTDGYIRIVPSAGGSLYAWASSVDNTSTDQIFIRPFLLASLLAGNWSGTTSQNLPVNFRIDEDGMIRDLVVRMRMSFPGFPPSNCTANMIREEPIEIVDSKFEIVLAYPPEVANVFTSFRGSFSNEEAVSGTYDGFTGSFFVRCGGSIIFGTGGTLISPGTWSATAQK